MRMRRQQSANHESKQLNTGRVSTKSLSRAFNNGYQIPKWPITEILGEGVEWMELLPSGDKKEATYKKEKINEKCHNYLLILEIKWQERVSSFISGKKSAIDSEIPCWTNGGAEDHSTNKEICIVTHQVKMKPNRSYTFLNLIPRLN